MNAISDQTVTGREFKHLGPPTKNVRSHRAVLVLGMTQETQMTSVNSYETNELELILNIWLARVKCFF